MAEQAEKEQELLYQISSFFPLKDNESVIMLFADQLRSPEPNLAALSLVCGYMEHHLTCKAGSYVQHQKDNFPVLDFNCFCQLYGQYTKLVRQKLNQNDFRIKTNLGDYGVHKDATTINDANEQRYCHDGSDFVLSGTNRKIIKAIADFVWGQLSTSYFKDRPHIQNLHSFLNGKRLDCFGVAMVVVMTAQYFGLNDVHLSLSEDHAWVVFGKDREENAEVTWHGRRDEIKRGTPIGEGSLVKFSENWLYLGGYGMKCDRKMEVAAIVSTMNPGINSKTDSELLGRLQQELLWYLFDQGHLNRYPMAICNLADLEEVEASRKSPSIAELYEKAILVAEVEHSGCHVYPYTYYGGYLHRQKQFSKAAEQWKDAAMTAARYTHSREDEELYKDLNEVANTFFPEIIKSYKMEVLTTANQCTKNGFFNSAQNLINIIKFYDGVCSWEEGGTAAVLHSEWAKNFSKTLSLFPLDIRVSCKAMFEEPTLLFEDHRPQHNLRSNKMKLVWSLMNDTKINSQIVNLYLTSQAAFESKSTAKRLNEAEQGITSRSKRYKL